MKTRGKKGYFISSSVALGLLCSLICVTSPELVAAAAPGHSVGFAEGECGLHLYSMYICQLRVEIIVQPVRGEYRKICKIDNTVPIEVHRRIS